MRAIGVTTYGGPEALGEHDLAAEPLGAGQVRLRVAAAAVNPTDTLVRSGARSPHDQAPTVDVPGMDVAGTVLELGEGVERLTVGERVMAIVVPSGEHGGYREDVVVPAGSVVAVPAGSSDAEASSLPMNALTARYSLDLLGLEPGQVLAVTGAAGAYGGYVVQLAKAHGLRVVADAKDSDVDLVRGLGADVVLPRGDGFAAAVLAEVPGGVDGLADGAVQGPEVTAAVRDGGGFATVRGWDGDGDTRLTYRPTLVRDVAERTDWLEEVRDLVEHGGLTPRVAEVLPASQATEAHRRLEAGGVRGRIVLDLR